MLVPRYWAEARARHKEPGRQLTVRRFGWSQDSREDAEAMAQRRADDALARLLAGERVHRRDRKIPYNGADGLPIREEIVEEHDGGRVVITRNSYGARCLNVPDVLFADVDFQVLREPGCFLFVWVAVAAGVAWWMGAGALLVAGAGLVALVVVGLVHLAVGRWMQREKVALGRLRRWSQAHPDWGLRIYRTPAGLRVIATHQTFDCARDAKLIQSFFRAIGADQTYARMCATQQCFRARVSPKPWRMGIADHMRPRPGVWPVSAERMPEREAWIARYEEAAADFAACRYVVTMGRASMHPVVEKTVEIHDRISGALSERKIA